MAEHKILSKNNQDVKKGVNLVHIFFTYHFHNSMHVICAVIYICSDANPAQDVDLRGTFRK